MNRRAASIDLSALQRGATGADIPPPKRRWLWLVVPIVLILAFLGIMAGSLQELFTDPVPVTVIRPAGASAKMASTGQILFQAAGWVEPDPFAVRVSALASGIVETVLVQESDAVKKGDVLAELIKDDAQLAFDAAAARVATAAAALDKARVEAVNATESYEAAIDVTARLAEQEASIEGHRAELAQQRAGLAEGEAALRVAITDYETQKLLREEGAVGPWQVEQAEARRDEKAGALERMKAGVSHAAAEVKAAEARLAEARRNRELRLQDKLRLETAKAVVAEASASLKLAEVARDEAELRLSRMTVRAPCDGIVLTRDALPGSNVGTEQHHEGIAHLYDPDKLRIRVDVPQGSVAQASVGQRAEIRCDVVRGKVFSGEVIRVTSKADIQKVTLEVQVRVEGAGDDLRPDMLCQVAVRAPVETASSSAPKESAAVRIPVRCLVGEDAVWVVGAEGDVAESRTVTVAQKDAEWALITAGLNLSDKVIDQGRERLEGGTSIKVEER